MDPLSPITDSNFNSAVNPEWPSKRQALLNKWKQIIEKSQSQKGLISNSFLNKSTPFLVASVANALFFFTAPFIVNQMHRQWKRWNCSSCNFSPKIEKSLKAVSAFAWVLAGNYGLEKATSLSLPLWAQLAVATGAAIWTAYSADRSREMDDSFLRTTDNSDAMGSWQVSKELSSDDFTASGKDDLQYVIPLKAAKEEHPEYFTATRNIDPDSEEEGIEKEAGVDPWEDALAGMDDALFRGDAFKL